MIHPPRTRNPASPIATRRLAKGWTQRDLARESGASLNAVKQAEAGALKTFPTETTRLIATALGCSVEDLSVSRGTYIIRDFGGKSLT